MPELPELCSACPPCLVAPSSYLVAFSGVLLLTFEGFPEPLARLKGRLTEAYGLQEEAPGSRFPKSSLAALKESKRAAGGSSVDSEGLWRKGFEGISGGFRGLGATKMARFGPGRVESAARAVREGREEAQGLRPLELDPFHARFSMAVAMSSVVSLVSLLKT